MKQLKREKDRIIAASSFRGALLTKGVVRQKLFWEEYHMVLSGSYVYFYQSKKDFVP